MKYSELKKLLKKNNCVMQSEGANHEIWYSPITQKKFTVGRHNTQDVAKGTYNAIMKQAGLSK